MKEKIGILKQNGDLTILGIVVVSIFSFVLALLLDVSATTLRSFYM